MARTFGSGSPKFWVQVLIILNAHSENELFVIPNSDHYLRLRRSGKYRAAK